MIEGITGNKKILVTGANGYIGSHIVNRMVAYGCEVFALVREASDLWRLEEVKGQIRIIKTDLRDGHAVFEWIERIKPNYIFHMAAYGVDPRQKNFVMAAESNVMGTLNVVKAASEIGCEKLINTGTCMQYGSKKGAIKEYENYIPSNIYGSTKAAATIIAHQIAGENNLDIITIIPFGVFGEREGSNRFFPNIILSVLRGEDVLLSPCEQFRDYCYIENIIDGFVMAAKAKDIKNDIFNIGSGTVYQLKHYVELLMSKMGKEGKVKYGAIEYRKNDLWSPQPDITKIKDVLGWEPRISFDEGINRTIEWYKGNMDQYSVKGR